MAQLLQHGGKILQDTCTVSKYNIYKDLIIVLNARLCGGAMGEVTPL